MNFSPDELVVPPDERVLVAVSSGADSLALLFWLHDLAREIVIGHVNHALHELRPGECENDEFFVKNVAQKLGIPFFSRTIELARKNGHVNEVVAREGRYRALLEIANDQNCGRLATAHTATDALESAILNLGRGGGVGGWHGIAPARTLENVVLARPFWNLGRETVRNWLRSRGEIWREDASNQSPLFRRNRVRHEVLPLLSEIFERETDVLARNFSANANLAREESDFLEDLAKNALESLLVRRDDGFLMLNGLKFADLSPVLARRVLRLGAREICPDFFDLSHTKIETVRLAVNDKQKRAVWMWRIDLKVEWTGAGSGNRLRFWRV